MGVVIGQLHKKREKTNHLLSFFVELGGVEPPSKQSA